MSEDLGGFKMMTFGEHEQAAELVGKLFAVAQPSAVFGEAQTVGEHTVITASEVKVGMGFGFGIGGGTGPGAAEGNEKAANDGSTSGYGGGGGGGGVSGGRPVAVIEVGPAGVRVEPVVDVTKIALAFFTTLGSMFLMRQRMKKLSKG